MSNRIVSELRAEIADIIHPWTGGDGMTECLDQIEKLLEQHVMPIKHEEMAVLIAPLLELEMVTGKKAKSDPRHEARVKLRNAFKLLGYNYQHIGHLATVVHEAGAVSELRTLNARLAELLQDQKVSEKLVARYGDMKGSKRLTREIKEINARKDALFKLYPDLAEAEPMSDEDFHAARLS